MLQYVIYNKLHLCSVTAWLLHLTQILNLAICHGNASNKIIMLADIASSYSGQQLQYNYTYVYVAKSAHAHS